MSDFKYKITSGNIPPSPSNPLREAHEQLEQAELLRKNRNFDRAETICSSLVRRYPDYFGALHTMGLICADKGDYRRAVGYLMQAAMLNPRSWETHAALAGVCIELDANEMASKTLEQARAIKPREPAILVTLGEVYSEEREYEMARDAYREALKVEPGMEEAAVGLARSCTSLGQYEEAMEVLDEMLRRGVRTLGIMLELVSLPTSVIRRDALAELEGMVRRPQDDKIIFERGSKFIRVAALEKAGRHAEAWAKALEANRSVAATVKDNLKGLTSERQVRLQWLQNNTISAKPPAAGDETLPISLFILGPSRSGKTTAEAVIAALDNVKRGYENRSVENAISRTFQAAGLLTLSSLQYLPRQFFPDVRKLYIEELVRRAGSARVFTYTHPGYIFDAPRLAEVLPNARFIFVKRNMEDILLRIFMKQYRTGNEYSYDLSAAREYVEWYYNMIDLMTEKLSNIVRVIHYEDMVADPTTVLRSAADLCGLPLKHGPLPKIGDDRGCASPYREFMAAELGR